MISPNILIGSDLMRAGVKVFPCREFGARLKSPYLNGGFKQATTDILIGEVWAWKFPYAVWGLPCALNNVLVLDADRHGKGDGVANLLALFARYGFEWRDVPTVATPNSGYHFYFNRPAGLGPTKARLCEAVDVRDNGYVIAPECQMGDGRWYRLVEGTLSDFAEAIAARALPDPPEWMLSMLVQPLAPKWGGHVRPVAVDDETLNNQIKGLILAVLRAEQGNRNNLLYWLACRLAELVRDDLLSIEVAEMLLDESGARIGLPTGETRNTAISGLRRILRGDHDAC
jgi:hypothetical protein